MSDMDDTDTTAPDQQTDEQPDPADKEWADLLSELRSEGLHPAQVQERLKASRKWEQRAKAADKEIAAARQGSMSETERAIQEAADKARKETLAEVGTRLAAAELRGELKDIVEDPDSIIEALDLRRFVDEDGNVDKASVKALREKLRSGQPKGGPDMKQGVRKAAPAPLDTDQWLRDKVANR